MKKNFFPASIIYIGMGILLGGCSKKQSASSIQGTAVLVKVAEVQKKPIKQKVTVSGVVRAKHSIPITAQTSGIVKKISFQPGGTVNKEQVLIVLEDEQAIAQLQQAKSQLQASQATLSRQIALQEKNYGQKSLLEKAKAEVAAAQAELAKAELNLKYTRITAPFQGYVGLCTLGQGSPIRQGDELTRLVSPEKEVEFELADSQASLIAVGQVVDVEGPSGLPLECQITAIEPYADAVAHTVKARASFPKGQGQEFRDGAFARLVVFLSRSEEAIVVPQQAVGSEGGQDFVYRVQAIGDKKQLKAVMTPVTVGAQEQDYVEVEGVNPGDLVVTDPVEFLLDGSPIKIQNP
ncbi:MAG: hypothetical protein BGO07_04490 [Alphaproteobacteria bacterium 40-19]|nr:MAG: hypothetical protein BGO07_04490 [Alphaproteobacteria bacterium 40-19]